MEKKKLVIFTGAGISKESGIDTFRDKGGLWDNHSVEEVADIRGWHADKKKVLDFYNLRRIDLEKIQPNKAHTLLKDLEEFFDVTIITQNVDDLHERAGSSKVIHLHGELTKVKIEDKDDETEYDIGYKSVELGDTPEKFGWEIDETLLNQLRPAVVWFGENVPKMQTAMDEVFMSDIFITIGTSLQVFPAASLIDCPEDKADVFIINPDMEPLHTSRKIHYIEKVATEGTQILYDHLTKDL